MSRRTHGILANVGTEADGDSGQAPGDDGSMGLQIDVSLGAGESTTITFMHTYGALTPGGEVGETTSRAQLPDTGS